MNEILYLVASVMAIAFFSTMVWNEIKLRLAVRRIRKDLEANDEEDEEDIYWENVHTMINEAAEKNTQLLADFVRRCDEGVVRVLTDEIRKSSRDKKSKK